MAAIAGRRYTTDGNRCHFVLLDKDESCPTADLSNEAKAQNYQYLAVSRCAKSCVGRTCRAPEINVIMRCLESVLFVACAYT